MLFKMKESLLTSGRGLDNRTGQPRLVGDIITEMFLGNSLLAKGYRKYLTSKENDAEKGGEV